MNSHRARRIRGGLNLLRMRVRGELAEVRFERNPGVRTSGSRFVVDEYGDRGRIGCARPDRVRFRRGHHLRLRGCEREVVRRGLTICHSDFGRVPRVTHQIRRERMVTRANTGHFVVAGAIAIQRKGCHASGSIHPYNLASGICVGRHSARQGARPSPGRRWSVVGRPHGCDAR